MNTFKQWERLQKAHQLIRQEKTGKPRAFAKKLKVSEREIYRILEFLKELQAIIAYSRTDNSYGYLNDFNLHIHLSVQTTVGHKSRRIYHLSNKS